MSQMINAAGFLYEPLFDHIKHSLVDALIHLFAWTVQAYFYYLERALFYLACAEAGVGFAGHVAYFEGVNNASGIVVVNDIVMFGV